MSDALNNYINSLWKRRSELTELISEKTKGRVYQGPFKGMKILPKWCWGDGDIVGKILGLYECELFDSIEEVIKSNPDIILNIGSAEGYYGIGLSLRTNQKTILFDISETAINIARENAKENFANKTYFLTDCRVEQYRKYLVNSVNPFILMDCEGAEEEILDLEVLPELIKTTVIVESHDCNRPGLTNKLIERFSRTHDIKLIPQGAKNPYLEITKDLCDYDKMILCCEARPSTMVWLYMVPKS
jgi:hypothetical protein